MNFRVPASAGRNWVTGRMEDGWKGQIVDKNYGVLEKEMDGEGEEREDERTR